MTSIRLAVIVVSLSLTGAVSAQSSSSSSSESVSTEHANSGIPISRLIASVAKKSGKKFVIDPRVNGNVDLVGEDVANVSYPELLTLLHVYGFTAVESGGYVTVIPVAGARLMPLPMVSGKDTRPDAQYVTTVITVKNVPAAQLVPIIRPMIPQEGHFAALPCVNKLILVDTFANVRRLETVIDSLDVGEPYKSGNCDGHVSSEHP
jgi:type II secretory pathway component GspD/PulD (secretin)